MVIRKDVDMGGGMDIGRGMTTPIIKSNVQLLYWV